MRGITYDADQLAAELRKSRARLDYLFEKTVDELERAATSAVDSAWSEESEMSPEMKRVREALRVLATLREMRT